MRLLSSEHAPVAVLALAASTRLSLSELATASGIAPSAAQRAVAILVDDGVANCVTAPGPRYRLADGPMAAEVLALSRRVVPLQRAASVTATASGAIEFIALRDREMVVVLSSSAGSARTAPAVRAVDGLCFTHGLTARLLEHDDVRRELLTSDDLRDEMRNAGVLFGDVGLTFPGRGRHAAAQGRPLRRPHPELPVLSRRLVRRIAREHGLSSMQLFGSAVRSDFAPDSDVDVLIRFRPGRRATLESLTEIELTLERALRRDVDITRDEMLRPELEAAIRAEAVEIL